MVQQNGKQGLCVGVVRSSGCKVKVPTRHFVMPAVITKPLPITSGPRCFGFPRYWLVFGLFFVCEGYIELLFGRYVFAIAAPPPLCCRKCYQFQPGQNILTDYFE